MDKPIERVLNFIKHSLRSISFGVALGLIFYAASLVFFDTSFMASILFLVCSVVLSTVYIALFDYLCNMRNEATYRNMEDIIEKISTGDLSDSLFYREGRGHIEGTIYFTIRKMVSELRRVIGRFMRMSRDLEEASASILEMTDDLSQGSRDQRESVEDVHRSLEETNSSIKGLRESVSELMDFTDDASSAILEMTANIEDVAGNAKDLTRYVEDTAAAMEEMASSVNQVAGNSKELYARASDNAASMAEMDASIEEVGENARLTAEISDAVMNSALEGKEAVSETSNGLKNIESSVLDATGVINKLGEQSEEIGKIVKVIKEIADQTNLLALNAAIIAAQAGKEGKGFAVVAEEIRDLSERTTGSATVISKMIKGTQVEVQKAVGIMNTGSDRVKQGVNLGKKAEQSLDIILERIKRSTESVEQIARATSEQAKGTRRITESTDEMTTMIEGITSATEQQASTSTDIKERADHMSDLTEHVSRAMEQQMTSSKSISEGMEKVNAVVAGISDAIKSLSSSGEKVMSAVEVIRQTARKNRAGARNLYSTVTSFRHESAFLKDEIVRFKLPRPRKGNAITIGMTKTLEVILDPAFSQNIKAGDLTHMLFDGLVRYGDGTDVHPSLARGWSLSQDGKTYTFFLRPDVSFHNGRQVKAEDVKASFERVLNPEFEAPSTWPLLPIEGARQFMDGEAEEVTGIKVLDEQTVSISLRDPVAFFLGMLTLPETYVIPKELRNKRGKEFNDCAFGTGPFILEEHAPDRIIRFRRNPDYHRQDIPYLENVNYRLDLNSYDEVPDLLRNGEIGFSTDVEIDQIVEMKQDPMWAANIHSTILLSTSFMAFQCEKAPFNDPGVRQAFNYAVNRQEIINKGHNGMYEKAHGILPPGILGYSKSLDGYDYNPDKARTLLKEAGYGSGLTIDYYKSEAQQKLNVDETLVFDFLRGIGVEVNVLKIPDEEYRRMKNSKELPFYWTGWYADYPDPDNFLYVLFHSRGSDVLGLKYRNEKLDDLVESARAESDIGMREKLYRKAESILVEDAPILFMHHQRGFVVHQPNLGGVKMSITPPLVRVEELWVQR